MSGLYLLTFIRNGDSQSSVADEVMAFEIDLSAPHFGNTITAVPDKVLMRRNFTI
jgi:hypothetical protein